MKAIVCTNHGPPDVLQLTEIEKPTPKDNEVLIKVHAATVTQGDLMLRKLHPLMYLPMRLFGVRRKKIPGHEFAGEVESVGVDVNRFKIGDQVFGTTTGLSVGANAEYLCLPEEWESGVLAIKPDNISFEEAAALPVGGMTALYILRKGNIQSGQRVLVYGASGSVGTFAVQLARNHFGAEVTGVCGTTNIELVKSLGAQKVIDYTKESIKDNNESYDIIYDAVGKSSFSECIKSLKKDGYYLRSVHMGIIPIARGLWTKMTSNKKIVGGISVERQEDLRFLAKMMEEKKFKPVIDKIYPLNEISEAHRHVDQGHKKGNVAVTIQ